MKVIEALLAAGLICTDGSSQAAETRGGVAATANVHCTAEGIETSGRDHTIIATGNAACSFGSFAIRAHRIEIQQRPETPHGVRRVLVMARGSVVLQQGDEDLALHTLTLEADVPR
jgi:hypothetical protein